MTDTRSAGAMDWRAAYDGEWGRVIVGIDDSAGGIAALQRGVDLARSYGAELVAVRAWALGLPQHGGRRHRRDGRHLVVLEFPGAEQREAAVELVRRMFRAATDGLPPDLAVSIETPEGDPGTVLTQFATNPDDLLVVGTQRDHFLRRLRHGSVSKYCQRRSSCPVVVVDADQQAQVGQWP
jgi:nucleotide-binding universal stress UspA family protein